MSPAIGWSARLRTTARRLPVRSRGGAVLLVLATVVGLGIGEATARSIHDSATPHPYGDAPVLRVAGIGVLAAPQRARDRAVVPASASLLAGSLRLLAAVPGDPSSLYAARDRSGQVCLVDAEEQGLRFAASCAPASVLARSGIALTWSRGTTSAHASSSPRSGYEARHFTAVWGPDDRLRLASAPS